jgi:signal transduction histidine kinase
MSISGWGIHRPFTNGRNGMVALPGTLGKADLLVSRRDYVTNRARADDRSPIDTQSHQRWLLVRVKPADATLAARGCERSKAMVRLDDDVVTMGSGAGGSLTRTQPKTMPSGPVLRQRRPNVIPLAVRQDRATELQRGVVFALATSDDLPSVMPGVVERIRWLTAVARVEWWVVSDHGSYELAAAAGIADGDRRDLPVGPAGAFVLYGDAIDPALESWLVSLGPLIRRRLADERLEEAAVRLARRNQELEDFAALVAHELKAPLQAALVAADPSPLVGDALDLVDTLLALAGSEPPGADDAGAAAWLDDVLHDLGTGLVLTSAVTTTLPISRGSLRVILRNLLANAVAARAGHVHVATERTEAGWELRVDDDGVGLGDADGYVSGSGLGLSLCRRLAARFGGVLDLAPASGVGTRATLRFTPAP